MLLKALNCEKLLIPVVNRTSNPSAYGFHSHQWLRNLSEFIDCGACALEIDEIQTNGGKGRETDGQTDKQTQKLC